MTVKTTRVRGFAPWNPQRMTIRQEVIEQEQIDREEICGRINRGAA